MKCVSVTSTTQHNEAMTESTPICAIDVCVRNNDSILNQELFQLLE